MPRYIGYIFTGTANSTVVTPALNGGVTDSKYNSGVWSISDSSGEEYSLFTRRKQGNWLTTTRNDSGEQKVALNVKMWGAGTFGEFFYNSSGGAGGHTQGTIYANTGTTYTVVVGFRGTNDSTAPGPGVSSPNNYGGGGGTYSAVSPPQPTGWQYGKPGGGLTGIFEAGSAISFNPGAPFQPRAIMIAGGAGAPGYFSVPDVSGGGGGGSSGEDGPVNPSHPSGGGGTQIAGGAAGGPSASAGTALTGGLGGDYSGGGGGGYYGGGGGHYGGGSGAGAGGGGSGYIGGTLTTTVYNGLTVQSSASTNDGSAQTAAFSSDPDFAPYSNHYAIGGPGGSGGPGSFGGNGIMFIIYSDSGSPTTEIFKYTGSDQTFTVPATADLTTVPSS